MSVTKYITKKVSKANLKTIYFYFLCHLWHSSLPSLRPLFPTKSNINHREKLWNVICEVNNQIIYFGSTAHLSYRKKQWLLQRPGFIKLIINQLENNDKTFQEKAEHQWYIILLYGQIYWSDNSRQSSEKNGHTEILLTMVVFGLFLFIFEKPGQFWLIMNLICSMWT